MVFRHSWSSDQSLNNERQSSANRQRLLLPLEPFFKALSDPSVVIKALRYTWDSDRSVSKKRSSRKDLSSSKTRTGEDADPHHFNFIIR